MFDISVWQSQGEALVAGASDGSQSGLSDRRSVGLSLRPSVGWTSGLEGEPVGLAVGLSALASLLEICAYISGFQKILGEIISFF